MRLWHYKLIKVLPRQQLLSQWRECCCIAVNILNNGTPNHLLVNKVLDYNYNHFLKYCQIVKNELLDRGYNASEEVSSYLISNIKHSKKYFNNRNNPTRLFNKWHNKRYLSQCYYNLEEKYDCGGISKEEWNKLLTVGGL